MIDVVIPYHPKDEYTIHACIDTVKKHFKQCGQVYILSESKFTYDDVKWIPETSFSLTKEFVSEVIERYKKDIPEERHGWLYQQFLKMSVFHACPELSDTILVLDSDVSFVNDYDAYDEEGRLAYNHNHRYFWSYIENNKLIHPEFQEQKKEENRTGINHMMLFERHRMRELIDLITRGGQSSLVEGVISRIQHNLKNASFSEYELYFQYIHSKYPDEYALRQDDWYDVNDWKPVINVQDYGYARHWMHDNATYIANHSWCRDPKLQDKSWFKQAVTETRFDI